MPQARDEAGNIWEVDAQGNHIRLISQAGAPQGAIPIGPRDTSKAQSQENEAERLRLARQAAVISAQDNVRDEARLGMTAEDQGRQNDKARIDNPQALRKEFSALPEVKAYNVAVQQLAQALNTGDGAQADLALTYAFAKAMDPDSVVRDAEQGMIINSQPWVQAAVANIYKQAGVEQGGVFSPQARAALRQQIIRSVDSREKIYAGKRSEFGQLAQRYGIDPYEVVGEHSGETFRKQFRDYDDQRRKDGANVGGIQTERKGDAPPALGAGPAAPVGPQGFDPSRVWKQGSEPALKPASGALLGPKQRQQYDREFAAQIDALIRSGATQGQLDAYSKSQGYGTVDNLPAVQEYLRRNPGYKGSLVNPPVKAVDQSALERFSQGAPGAALIGAGNMGSFGGVEALDPEKYALSQAAHPWANMSGSIGGSIFGTGFIGAVGRKGAQAIAPNMLGGAGKAQFGRNLAADAGYGAAYGGVTEGDPFTGAVFAAGGSASGQGLGGAAGRILRGARTTPNAQPLLDAGIPLTVGQRMGGQAKSIEDRFMGSPIVGDVVRDRRIEGLQGLENVVQNQAGKPIGAQFAPGGSWIDELPPEFGGAYDSATAGVNVPLDTTLSQDFQAAGKAVNALPQPYRDAYGNLVDHTFRKEFGGGQLSGEGYQNAIQTLKRAKGKADNIGDGVYAPDYRTILSQVQASLRDQMVRGGGNKVALGLDNADEAYRMAKVIQSAQQKAVNGSMSGVPGLPTPAQLNNASIVAAKKYPGPRPFADFLKAAQDVLPSKVPDSGTAGRLAQLALPGAVLGGAGVGGLAGGTEGSVGGAATPLAILGLLALGASKKGQKGLEKLIFERYSPLKKVGATLSKGQKKGLFGAPTIPFLMEAQNQ